MKTLNLTLRTILLTLFFASTTTTTLAYNFMVNGIYYNIKGNEASVTYIDYTTWDSNHSVYGEDCYNYFNEYKNSISIPETVTYNGSSYTVTAIGDHAFSNCSSLENVSIPKTVTSIGNYAFYGCSRLLDITIPVAVSVIGDYAFYSCKKLSYITIPDSIVLIGSCAFKYCSRLSTIVIGSSVISIGSSAFSNCQLLLSITCLATTPPSADGFPNTSTAKLYVPKESVELYRTTSGWNYFTNVYGFGNDSFSVPDNTSFHGDTIVIPVSMQNESEVTAFQTDIYLPEGFELFKKNGEYHVSLSDRKGRDHVIMVNDAPDGALRVLSYSPTLKPFKNNEGELFYITVKVPEGISGTFPIWLRNTILTSTDEEELYAIDALSNVSVTNIIKGDANNDGLVTVTDVVTTARYILNYNPESFAFEAADMNGDGKITITDVVKIANLVLDQNYEEPAIMQMMAPNMAGDRMFGEMIGNTVNINLDNALEYTAIQMDVTLPEGMTASDFELTNRASDLGLIVKDRGNGEIRALAYTPDLKSIKGNDGPLLTFVVDGNMGDIVVDHIELVNLNGESIRLNGFNMKLNNTVTSVKEIGTAIRTYSDGSNIIIDSPQRMTVTITDVMGCSRQVDIASGSNIINAGSGVYIVNAGGEITKLLLK